MVGVFYQTIFKDALVYEIQRSFPYFRILIQDQLADLLLLLCVQLVVLHEGCDNLDGTDSHLEILVVRGLDEDVHHVWQVFQEWFLVGLFLVLHILHSSHEHVDDILAHLGTSVVCQ